MLLGIFAAISAVAAAVICALGGWTSLPGVLLGMVGGFFGCFVLLILLAAVFAWAICLPVDTSVPQEEDSKLFRFLMYPYMEALMTLAGMKITMTGLEKIPMEGRLMVVCNHQNEADPGVLHMAFKGNPLAFISKKEVGQMFLVNKVMHRTLSQLLDRENDRAALKTILRCIQLIKEDKISICAFPEGGIFEEFKLNPFRPGVFKIAQKAQVPIVVCTIQGTTALFRNMKKLKPTPVELHILDVIPAQVLEGKTTVEIADQVHAMMAKDLGPTWKLEET